MITFALLVTAAFALVLLPCLIADALLNLRRNEANAVPLFTRTTAAA